MGFYGVLAEVLRRTEELMGSTIYYENGEFIEKKMTPTKDEQREIVNMVVAEQKEEKEEDLKLIKEKVLDTMCLGGKIAFSPSTKIVLVTTKKPGYLPSNANVIRIVEGIGIMDLYGAGLRSNGSKVYIDIL